MYSHQTLQNYYKNATINPFTANVNICYRIVKILILK